MNKMKNPESRTQTRAWLWPLCFIILHSSFCLPARGQSYSIDWNKVAGGGGVSTGGVYTVTGTIGQPDAGAMTGGSYSLTGGFWSWSPLCKRRVRRPSRLRALAQA